MKLEVDYPNQIEILKELFGGDAVDSNIDRLNDIYEQAEETWQKNLERLKGHPVKYLLLAEAPPWTEATEKKDIRYFYNNFEGKWCTSIWKTFFQEKVQPPFDECLTKLAKKGFLLIDTLPFAMKYTSAIRRGEKYKKLIKECLPVIMKKVNEQNISWDNGVRLAFAFKLNAKAIIDSFPNGLPLNSKKLPVSEDLSEYLSGDLIAADGSGFTSSSKLKEIFKLEQGKEVV